MKEMKYDAEPITQLLDINWYGDGMAYAVFNVRGSHPCAYIQFPEIGKVKDYDSFFIDEDIDDINDFGSCIHGGFTFLGGLENIGLPGIWIGWDYAHLGDYCSYSGLGQWHHHIDEKKWTTEEVVSHAKKAIEYIRKGKYEIVVE